MQSVLDLIFGPLGLIFILVAFAVALILFAIPLFLKAQSDPFERLKDRKAELPPKRDDALRRAEITRLERYKSFLEPQNAEELTQMRMEMVRAGFRASSAVQVFHFAQLVASLSLLAVGAACAFIFTAGTNAPLYQTMLWIIVPGLVGYFGPRYWLKAKQEQRQDEISQGFPDALDMMLVCVEAGQSLDQSISRVAGELHQSFPTMAEELEMVSYEIRAGKDKNTVLKDMADRVDVPDVASFVTVLIQSQTFGTSISEALRMYSSEMRDKRVMRAEEKANTLPTKMSLATMLLTVPPLMLILIGPSIYRVYLTLAQGVF